MLQRSCTACRRTRRSTPAHAFVGFPGSKGAHGCVVGRDSHSSANSLQGLPSTSTRRTASAYSGFSSRRAASRIGHASAARLAWPTTPILDRALLGQGSQAPRLRGPSHGHGRRPHCAAPGKTRPRDGFFASHLRRPCPCCARRRPAESPARAPIARPALQKCSKSRTWSVNRARAFRDWLSVVSAVWFMHTLQL